MRSGLEAQGGAVGIHRKYQSFGANKSIVISIIDRDFHRRFTAKRLFSQANRLIPSAASDGLTDMYNDRPTNCDTKAAQQIAFTIKMKLKLKVYQA